MAGIGCARGDESLGLGAVRLGAPGGRKPRADLLDRNTVGGGGVCICSRSARELAGIRIDRPLRAPRRRCASASKMRPFALQPLRLCFGQGDPRDRSDGRLPPCPARRGSAQSVRRTPPRVAARVPPPTRPPSARDDPARGRNMVDRSPGSRPSSGQAQGPTEARFTMRTLRHERTHIVEPPGPFAPSSNATWLSPCHRMVGFNSSFSL